MVGWSEKAWSSTGIPEKFLEVNFRPSLDKKLTIRFWQYYLVLLKLEKIVVKLVEQSRNWRGSLLRNPDVGEVRFRF